MITINQLRTNLKQDGLELTEQELSLIQILLVKLATIEHQLYLVKNREEKDGKLKTKRDIGVINLFETDKLKAS